MFICLRATKADNDVRCKQRDHSPQEDSSSALGQSTCPSQTHSDMIHCASGHRYWFIGQSTNVQLSHCTLAFCSIAL